MKLWCKSDKIMNPFVLPSTYIRILEINIFMPFNERVKFLVMYLWEFGRVSF